MSKCMLLDLQKVKRRDSEWVAWWGTLICSKQRRAEGGPSSSYRQMGMVQRLDVGSVADGLMGLRWRR